METKPHEPCRSPGSSTTNGWTEAAHNLLLSWATVLSKTTLTLLPTLSFIYLAHTQKSDLYYSILHRYSYVPSVYNFASLFLLKGPILSFLSASFVLYNVVPEALTVNVVACRSFTILLGYHAVTGVLLITMSTSLNVFLPIVLPNLVLMLVVVSYMVGPIYMSVVKEVSHGGGGGAAEQISKVEVEEKGWAAAAVFFVFHLTFVAVEATTLLLDNTWYEYWAPWWGTADPRVGCLALAVSLLLLLLLLIVHITGYVECRPWHNDAMVVIDVGSDLP